MRNMKLETLSTQKLNRAITIAVVQEKGGVGKTTTASTVAAGLAAMGCDVAGIDADPQGHFIANYRVFSSAGYPPDMLFDVVSHRRPVHEALTPIPSEKVTLDIPEDMTPFSPPGRLDILSGYLDTTLIPAWIRSHNNNWEALREVIAPLHETHDFIIIDTPPTKSEMTPAIIAASDYVLIPTLPEALSIRQTSDTLESIANLSKYGDVQLLGIIPMMVRDGVLLHEESLDELTDAFGEAVWNEAYTSLSIIWGEASAVGMSVMQYAPGHKAAYQAWRIVQKVLESVGVKA